MIEQELRALGAALEWPQTPDLVPAVRARMAPAPPARRRWRWRPHGPLALAAAVLLVLVVATALVPPARSAVLRVLGLTGSARIVQAPRAPDVSRGPLDLGRPIALAEARRRAPFLRLPAALGAPAQARWSDRLAGGAVTLRWTDGDALTEFQGRGIPFLEKFASQPTRVRRIRVGTAPGYFLDGAPHEVLVMDRNGIPIQGTRALVRGNVLLWDAGPIAYRLETRRGLRHALAVATSVRTS
ncbi:MAG TPA: hypothetical protein VH276_09270 [Solirubrobacteraceae bacterium]|nr:hypothetical protein [Solirubrobacteraceae bacterium]